MALVPFRRGQQSAEAADDDPWAEPEDDGAGAKMTFLEHLDELRKRIIIALSAVAVGTLIAFAFVDRIYNFVMDPLYALLPKGGSTLVYTEPTEAFILWVWMALLAGILIAMPVVLWQVWLFIAPGLYQKEKKLAIPFIVLASAGFLVGAAFTHYLLFPWMWKFFGSFASDKLTFMPRIDPVFDLYIKMILGMGLVTWRFLLRHFKYAILIIFILAAVITPSGDMLTQTLFAAPMIGLYMISIAIAWIVAPRKKPAPVDAE